MPIMANLVIADGASTPVNHTLTPDFGQNGDRAAQWSEKTTASPLQRLTATLKSATSKEGVMRVTPSIIAPVPFVVSANCCPKADDPINLGVNYGNAIFNFHKLSTEQQRVDVLRELQSFLASASVLAAVKSGEISW